MYWKRGPAARGHGQQMDSAVRPQEGMGQTASQDMVEAIKKMIPGDDGGGMDSGISSMTGLEPGISSSITETALEPGGMSSISEIMQGQAGEMSPMGYASPFGDPTADELGIGGGSGSALGPGYAEGPGRTVFDDTGGPASNFGGPTPDELGIGGGSGSALPKMTYYNDYLPMDSGQGDYSGSRGYFFDEADIDQEGMPARYNRVGRFEKPSSRMPIAQFLKSLFSGSGAATGSPLRRGQLGPLSQQGQAAVSASQASAPFGRDRFGRPRTQ
jgi:hypothetical protein